MPLHPFTSFSRQNRKLIYILAGSHLLWCGALFILWLIGQSFESVHPLWSGLFLLLQLFAAAQLLLPILLLHPEERSRSFYLFWACILSASIWLLNQLPSTPLHAVLQSALLLLIATLVGAALARYVKRLWELIPICLAMTLADFASWSQGPTALFSEQIKDYYLAPQGPPPLIDMVLIKLAFPGTARLTPAFGISDWIMVVFFAIVAHHHNINDNLLGPAGESLAQRRQPGCYLPVSVVALMLAIILAQTSGLFLPALPLIALIMLFWYAGRSFYLTVRQKKKA